MAAMSTKSLLSDDGLEEDFQRKRCWSSGLCPGCSGCASGCSCFTADVSVSRCSCLTADDCIDTLSFKHAFQIMKTEVMNFFTDENKSNSSDCKQIQYVTTRPTDNASDYSSIVSFTSFSRPEKSLLTEPPVMMKKTSSVEKLIFVPPALRVRNSQSVSIEEIPRVENSDTLPETDRRNQSVSTGMPHCSLPDTDESSMASNLVDNERGDATDLLQEDTTSNDELPLANNSNKKTFFGRWFGSASQRVDSTLTKDVGGQEYSLDQESVSKPGVDETTSETSHVPGRGDASDFIPNVEGKEKPTVVEISERKPFFRAWFGSTSAPAHADSREFFGDTNENEQKSGFESPMAPGEVTTFGLEQTSCFDRNIVTREQQKSDIMKNDFDRHNDGILLVINLAKATNIAEMKRSIDEGGDEKEVTSTKDDNAFPPFLGSQFETISRNASIETGSSYEKRIETQEQESDKLACICEADVPQDTEPTDSVQIPSIVATDDVNINDSSSSFLKESKSFESLAERFGTVIGTTLQLSKPAVNTNEGCDTVDEKCAALSSDRVVSRSSKESSTDSVSPHEHTLEDEGCNPRPADEAKTEAQGGLDEAINEAFLRLGSDSKSETSARKPFLAVTENSDASKNEDGRAEIDSGVDPTFYEELKPITKKSIEVLPPVDNNTTHSDSQDIAEAEESEEKSTRHPARKELPKTEVVQEIEHYLSGFVLSNKHASAVNSRHSESLVDENITFENFVSTSFCNIAKSFTTKREKLHSTSPNEECDAVEDSTSSSEQCNGKSSLPSINNGTTQVWQKEESNNTMAFVRAVSDLVDPIVALMPLDIAATMSVSHVNMEDHDKVLEDATEEMPFNVSMTHMLEPLVTTVNNAWSKGTDQLLNTKEDGISNSGKSESVTGSKDEVRKVNSVNCESINNERVEMSSVGKGDSPVKSSSRTEPNDSKEVNNTESINMEPENSSKCTPPSAISTDPTLATHSLRKAKPSGSGDTPGGKVIWLARMKDKASKATDKERNALHQESVTSIAAKTKVSSSLPPVSRRRAQKGKAATNIIRIGSRNQEKSKKGKNKKLSSTNACVDPNTQWAQPSDEQVELVLNAKSKSGRLGSRFSRRNQRCLITIHAGAVDNSGNMNTFDETRTPCSMTERAKTYKQSREPPQS